MISLLFHKEFYYKNVAFSFHKKSNQNNVRNNKIAQVILPILAIIIIKIKNFV